MAIYNITADFLGNGTGKIPNAISDVMTFSCSQNFFNIFIYFLLPLLIGLLLLIILKFKEEIKLKYLLYFSKRGYIRIWYITPNKKIIEHLKKLDKFNNFVFSNRKYNLEKMYNFLIGYDKYNFPIFMYDFNFILPLKVTKKDLDQEIIEQFNLDVIKDQAKRDKCISQITLKMDSSILKTVYDKKLLSDLYSISKGSLELKQKIIYAVLIFAGLIILYYTGLLAKILAFVGIEI